MRRRRGIGQITTVAQFDYDVFLLPFFPPSLLDPYMDLNSSTDPGSKHWNHQTAKQIAATPPKNSSPTETGVYRIRQKSDFVLTRILLAYMFNNAQNTHITGGSLNVTNTTKFNTVYGALKSIAQLIC